MVEASPELAIEVRLEVEEGQVGVLGKDQLHPRGNEIVCTIASPLLLVWEEQVVLQDVLPVDLCSLYAHVQFIPL